MRSLAPEPFSFAIPMAAMLNMRPSSTFLMTSSRALLIALDSVLSSKSPGS